MTLSVKNYNNSDFKIFTNTKKLFLDIQASSNLNKKVALIFKAIVLVSFTVIQDTLLFSTLLANKLAYKNVDPNNGASICTSDKLKSFVKRNKSTIIKTAAVAITISGVYYFGSKLLSQGKITDPLPPIDLSPVSNFIPGSSEYFVDLNNKAQKLMDARSISNKDLNEFGCKIFEDVKTIDSEVITVLSKIKGFSDNSYKFVRKLTQCLSKKIDDINIVNSKEVEFFSKIKKLHESEFIDELSISDHLIELVDRLIGNISNNISNIDVNFKKVYSIISKLGVSSYEMGLKDKKLVDIAHEIVKASSGTDFNLIDNLSMIKSCLIEKDTMAFDYPLMDLTKKTIYETEIFNTNTVTFLARIKELFNSKSLFLNTLGMHILDKVKGLSSLIALKRVEEMSIVESLYPIPGIFEEFKRDVERRYFSGY